MAEWGPGAINHPAIHMSRQYWSDVANDDPGECYYCGTDLNKDPEHNESTCPGCD